MTIVERIASRIRRPGQPPGPPPDLEPEFLVLYERARPYTMTSIERMYALWQAVRYISLRQITGDIAECGVWRGGSSLLAALTLEQVGDTSRTLHLFDTFEGMPPPSDRDVMFTGQTATASLASVERQSGAWNDWCYATLDDVRQTMALADHPNVSYVDGRVETTIPARAPDRLALLRLDTDWYESTIHELRQLYPRLVSGGILIVDDYGHWQGARAAVDEYFANDPVLLGRIDYTGRLVVKP